MAKDRNYSEFSSGRNDNLYKYTKGGQFSLDGIEYIGEYHFLGNTAKTGPVPTPDARILQRLYRVQDHYIYDRNFDFDVKVLSFVEPRPYLYVPKEQAYTVGTDIRYFVEKVEDSESYAIEIDQAQYDNIGKEKGIDNGIYTFASINWKLTGRRQDIIDHNELQLYKASATVPSINYAVRNFLEFARITLV